MCLGSSRDNKIHPLEASHHLHSWGALYKQVYRAQPGNAVNSSRSRRAPHDIRSFGYGSRDLGSSPLFGVTQPFPCPECVWWKCWEMGSGAHPAHPGGCETEGALSCRTC